MGECDGSYMFAGVLQDLYIDPPEIDKTSTITLPFNMYWKLCHYHPPSIYLGTATQRMNEEVQEKVMNTQLPPSACKKKTAHLVFSTASLFDSRSTQQGPKRGGVIPNEVLSKYRTADSSIELKERMTGIVVSEIRTKMKMNQHPC